MRFKRTLLVLPLTVLLFACGKKTTTRIPETTRIEPKTTNKTTVDDLVNVIFVDEMGTVLSSERVKKGSTVNKITIDEKEGKEFKGWFHNGIAWNFDDPINDDLVLVENWNNKIYKITTFTTCRDCSDFGYTMDYAYQSPVKISYKGNALVYGFEGWYEGDTLLSNEITYSFNMPAKDMNIEARFYPIGDIENFIYYRPSVDVCLEGPKEGATLGDTIEIPEGFTIIDIGIRDITTQEFKLLKIPNSVHKIEYRAFLNVTIESIILGKGIHELNRYAFENCNIERVYYAGNEEDWDRISKEENNGLDGVKVYFYSIRDPEENDKYWHYDDNNNPLVWVDE